MDTNTNSARSIQSRLARGLLFSLIVLLVTQWIVVAFSIRDLSERYIVSRLMHATDTLVAAVTLQNNKPPALDLVRIDPIYSKPFSGHYYTIAITSTSTSTDSTFHSRSLWDEALPIQAAEPGKSISHRMAGPQSQQLLVVSSGFEKQGEMIAIAVAEDIAPLEKDIERFLMQHGAGSLLILLLLIAVQIVIVRKSLQPIEETRKNLQDLETGVIESLNENVPGELHPLVHEINVRIKAVQQRLQRSRHATGNLAHALKSPLTLLQQLAQHDAIKSDSELHQQLLSYTARIQQIIDRELKRARLAGNVIAGRQSRIKPELDALIDSLRAMYRDKSLSIEYQMPDDCVSTLDREDLHEILGNLLDNACKWARKEVSMAIQCDEGLSISIEDDGPGIPEQQRELILRRGQRLDEQTTGHGLGLAIVKDAVDQYEGQLSLSESKTLGGLCVVISLPVK
jgi:signal transduction histidine kinase